MMLRLAKFLKHYAMIIDYNVKGLLELCDAVVLNLNDLNFFFKLFLKVYMLNFLP